ncbi:MAG TPA: lectin like domain-containing protein, partial [Candidatus Glassbacteria bacterium]|nr:lectin like domain-containing protein [Candidatus Glassbacteria bacterium]
LEAVSTYFAYDSMEYTVELYTGIDSGWLKCPVSWQQGQTPAAGWLTVELKQPVWLAAGDTAVAVVGYRSAGFDESYPVPVDWTGRAEGRSFANYSGLGRFEPVGGDVSLRAVIRSGVPATSAILLDPKLGPLPELLDFGRVFTGENYNLVLSLKNFGYRPLPLERVELTGSGYSLPDVPHSVPCNGENDLNFQFDPAAGDGSGRIDIFPASGEPVAVPLAATPAGYSVRYDSAQAPAGIGAYTEAAHGAVTFFMPRRGVVAGVRTYILQDSMKVNLRLWGEAAGGRGRCLLVETADTLITSRGWRQLLLPVGVEVDSADSFVADLRYKTPGRPFNDLVPVDTALTASVLCFYNQRESEAWTVSRRPVA